VVQDGIDVVYRLIYNYIHTIMCMAMHRNSLRPETPGPPDSRGGCPYMALVRLRSA
jgi:hypothetical protein